MYAGANSAIMLAPIRANYTEISGLHSVATKKEVHSELLIGMVKITCVNNALCRCDAADSLQHSLWALFNRLN